MGCTHSSPSSSSTPQPFRPVPTKRTTSWSASSSTTTSSLPSTPISPSKNPKHHISEKQPHHSSSKRSSWTTSTSTSPSSPSRSSPSRRKTVGKGIEEQEGKEERPPLRVGYPYYEDVLWEAELAARRKKERLPCGRSREKVGGKKF